MRCWSASTGGVRGPCSVEGQSWRAGGDGAAPTCPWLCAPLAYLHSPLDHADSPGTRFAPPCSVLEPGRSLTLAEKGGAGAQLIVAHPAFRLVATMNPGGCGCCVPPCCCDSGVGGGVAACRRCRVGASITHPSAVVAATRRCPALPGLLTLSRVPPDRPHLPALPPPPLCARQQAAIMARRSSPLRCPTASPPSGCLPSRMAPSCAPSWSRACPVSASARVVDPASRQPAALR